MSFKNSNLPLPKGTIESIEMITALFAKASIEKSFSKKSFFRKAILFTFSETGNECLSGWKRKHSKCHANSEKKSKEFIAKKWKT